jgi:hypothetical protein
MPTESIGDKKEKIEVKEATLSDRINGKTGRPENIGQCGFCELIL